MAIGIHHKSGCQGQRSLLRSNFGDNLIQNLHLLCRPSYDAYAIGYGLLIEIWNMDFDFWWN